MFLRLLRLHLRLLILIPFLFHCISGFSNIEVKESLGGIIYDSLVLDARRRIDTEVLNQQASNKTDTTLLTPTYQLNLTCDTDDLTTFHDATHPQHLVCNLTGYTNVYLSVSFDTDVYDMATLHPPFWLYFSPGFVETPVNMSILRRRIGSVYLNIWAREALPGGTEGVAFPFHRSNTSLVEEYTKWLVNGTDAYEGEDRGTVAMGLHLKILRKRGVLEIIFRVLVALMVCCLTLVMGCELDVKVIWKHLKRPISPLIGFLCQFGLMPLVSSSSLLFTPFTSYRFFWWFHRTFLPPRC